MCLKGNVPKKIYNNTKDEIMTWCKQTLGIILEKFTFYTIECKLVFV